VVAKKGGFTAGNNPAILKVLRRSPRIAALPVVALSIVFIERCLTSGADDVARGGFSARRTAALKGGRSSVTAFQIVFKSIRSYEWRS